MICDPLNRAWPCFVRYLLCDISKTKYITVFDLSHHIKRQKRQKQETTVHHVGQGNET